jgi:hypothetical protein
VIAKRATPSETPCGNRPSKLLAPLVLGDDDELQLTEPGHEDMQKVIEGTRACLESELSGWGVADVERLGGLHKVSIQLSTRTLGDS